MSRISALGLVLILCFSLSSVDAADWNRFRGPNGSGISPDGPTPIHWSDTENLKWKVELPGPGSSSPIVVGDKVFVTCWSGYGTDRNDLGNKEDLLLHLVCVDRIEGAILWQKPVEPTGREEDYRGMFAENGYASHTPCSDGERIYAFFGKSGVIAFDLEGNQLWKTSLGTESDRRGWGSAASPILYKDKVIIPATAESEALVALDKMSGEQIWRQEARGFAGTWGSPVISELEDGSKQIVMGVPYEVWGFNPESGKLKWYAETVESDSMCSSVVENDGVIYTIEGRSGGAAAVKVGGKGNVTESNVIWSGRNRGRISTPIYYKGNIYWISSGIANAISAESGEEVYQARMQPGSGSNDRSESSGRSFGRGRGFGGQSYSSPVVSDGKMYYVSRSGEVTVIKLGNEYEQLATNKFADDDSDFHGTPAISDGQLFIRSNKNLYCVSNE